MGDWERRAKDASRKVSVLEEEIKQLKSQHVLPNAGPTSEFEQELNTLREAKKNLEEQLQQSNNELGELRKSISEQQLQIEQLKERNKLLSDEMSQLKQKKSEMEVELNKRETSSVESKPSTVNLTPTPDMDTAKYEKAILELYTSYSQQIFQLKSENEELKRTVQQYENRPQNKQQDPTAFTSQLNSLAIKLGAPQSNNPVEMACQLVENTTKSMADLNSKYNQAIQTIRELQTQPRASNGESISFSNLKEGDLALFVRSKSIDSTSEGDYFEAICLRPSQRIFLSKDCADTLDPDNSRLLIVGRILLVNENTAFKNYDEYGVGDGKKFFIVEVEDHPLNRNSVIVDVSKS